jgi:hypothetical protein
MMQTKTPELDRRHELLKPRPVNDVLSEFYDWLRADGLVLARWHDQREGYVKCPDCTLGGILHPTGKDTSKLRRRQRQAIRDWPRRDGAGDHRVVPIHMREQFDAFLYATLDPLPPCPTCYGHMEVTVMRPSSDYLAEHHESPERLFARFLDLDLDKIDDEQRAILAELRAA